MTDDAIIHARIMRRVGRIHFLSRIIRPVFVKAGMGIVLLGLSFSLVSIADVLANMPAFFDLRSFLYFIGNAFVHTEWAVKGIVIGLCVLMVLMFKDILRSTLHHVPMQAA